ncbi:P-loop containing nucleoside triphosphate hydrolase protein [Mycena metata]|uniref:P-loop containing nucleoside triphosphate hydrolase protein n=1 Tax=Mycena metata TaxID=1033252 RepID=A0AAD7IL68_9AGAR|nr:P-loop containing nucleoside triphosphate hydrolase protein [Mycena metata]
MSLSYYLNKIRGSSTEATPTQAHGHVASSVGLRSDFSTILGFLHNSYVGSSLKLLVLGSIVETGRRLFRWLIDRFGIQYCTTIRFSQGDPAYEWIVLFLVRLFVLFANTTVATNSLVLQTQENVWRRSREFTVSASNSRRKWAVRAASDATVKANAEYVPTYQQPQLFRWRGYWVEIKRTGNVNNVDSVSPYGFAGHYPGHGSSIYITIYTLDMNVLSELVEEARLRYLEVNRPNVVIYLTDSPQFGPSQVWATVKHKMRRPLNSIILPEGVVDSLVADAQEFLSTENWYIEAGIPHRRGYLLYGPPGTGKTSTIYALAGALNLEIYSLSLASNFVDDSYLQRAASAIPKHGLFLIEDIDCAFPPREDDEDEEELIALQMAGGRRRAPRHGARTTRSMVTLSGLLNVIDGVGSEEGKLFFATTNHIDRLDGALLRPGRIDRRVQYELATPPQAHALFNRFFPTARFPDPVLIPTVEPIFVPIQPVIISTAAPTAPVELDAEKISQQVLDGPPLLTAVPALEDASLEATRPPIAALADTFAAAVPSGEFSTAELQGYLQGHKTRPAAAVRGVRAWVASVRAERAESERRKEERRAKTEQRKATLAAAAGGPGLGLQGRTGGLPVEPLSAAAVPVPVAADEASAASVNGVKGAHVNGNVEKSASNGVVNNNTE